VSARMTGHIMRHILLGHGMIMGGIMRHIVAHILAHIHIPADTCICRIQARVVVKIVIVNIVISVLATSSNTSSSRGTNPVGVHPVQTTSTPTRRSRIWRHAVTIHSPVVIHTSIYACVNVIARMNTPSDRCAPPTTASASFHGLSSHERVNRWIRRI
jgi:hypothetical protein